jgi:ubiquinone/menaquinone biosynthesis C-methylase UbiE
MFFSHFLRSQFSSPSGWFGSLVVAPFLNVTNMRSIDTGIELLAPRVDDRVLDVGFGGGYSLLALAKRLNHGAVVGVDHSDDMVNIAANLIREKRLSSRVRVCRGDVAKLPFPRGSFDKVLTVNTIYYWPNLRAGLREIARVLKSGGRLAVVFRSPWNLRLFTLGWEEFTLYEPNEVLQAMRDAGFRVLELVHRDQWLIPDTLVVVGECRKRQMQRPKRRRAQSSSMDA